MADEDEYMQGDIDMADSDHDLEEDAGGEDEDGMTDEAATPQTEKGEEASAIARRRAIQAIMRDKTISDQEKPMRIQSLMSGGRTEVAAQPLPVVPSPEGNACVHYERNCNIVAPCCNRVYGCRICHDELSTGHPPMNRFLIREVVCKLCGTRQPTGYVLHFSNMEYFFMCLTLFSPLFLLSRNQCVSCQAIFGEYHCNMCNLWMSKSKKPFHCAQCGFCRVGGVDAFRHCNECCMCISISVFDTHQCFKDKYKNNCPVCREDMFSSRQSPQDLPCGHAIHAHCFRKLAGFDYRCPICKKTVVSSQSMAAAWEARARDIAEHPMPADLQRVVDIMCNDCETKSYRRNWHFLGIQCPNCNSFNTVVEQVVSSGGGEANGTTSSHSST